MRACVVGGQVGGWVGRLWLCASALCGVWLVCGFWWVVVWLCVVYGGVGYVCATRLSAVGYILGKWAAVGKTQGR